VAQMYSLTQLIVAIVASLLAGGFIGLTATALCVAAKGDKKDDNR